jgi:hypothetical protein
MPGYDACFSNFIILRLVFTTIHEKDHPVRLFLFNHKIAETYCIKSPPDKNGGFLF